MDGNTGSSAAALAKTTDGSPLMFSDESQQQRFELGVSLVLHNWENLTTAVDNGWGGPDSEDKRDWMAGAIVELFESDYVDCDDVEDRLLGVMEDEFEVSIEDGSSLPVAVGIIQMYQQCAVKDYSKLDAMFAKFQERQRNRSNVARVPVSVQNADGDEDSESDEDDVPPTVSNEMEIDGAAQDRPQVNKEPVVDEDGFELVQKKRR